jgi:ATP-dependent helicase/nuclease subunit A
MLANDPPKSTAVDIKKNKKKPLKLCTAKNGWWKAIKGKCCAQKTSVPTCPLRMNPTTIQQKAISACGNVLVVAGAGTGKTSTLVQRCVARLQTGGSLENILMVTFTEAAAVEMRGRIRQAIQHRIVVFEKNSNEPGLYEHFQKQLALLDSALISTLHGFCLQLVREHFDELGIDPDVSVLDEQQTRPIIQQLIDAVFERHYAGTAPEDRAVQTLVRVQGRGSDERIRGLMLKLHRYSQSLAGPQQWFENQCTLFNQVKPQQWQAWFVEGFGEWSALWRPLLANFTGNTAVNLAVAALDRVSAGADFYQIGEALQAIQAADNDEKNWPRGSKKNVRGHLEQFFDEAEFLVSLVPKDETDPLAEDWELVRHDMLALLRLTGEFTEGFSRAKRDLGGLDFADLEQFALGVLRDRATGAPTPAARQWQGRLEHVFVDEYQDINAAQDAILSALSREGADANRFLVGDVKQSIYRFRLADPTIFRSYEELWGKGAAGSQRLSLTDNFRSRQGILDFINPLFRTLMRESIGGLAYEELSFGDPAGRAGLGAKDNSSPRVELHLITKAGQEIDEGADESGAEPSEVGDLLATEREARLIGLRLRRLKDEQHEIWDQAGKQFRPVEWSDMAVLLRSPASRAEAFAKEFARLAIPLEAARGGFFESPEISDLVSLLKLLDNPLQDVPLLAVLHSPLVGMSPAELAAIRASEPLESRPKFFWLAARQFRQRGDKAGSAGRKLDLFFTQLARWRDLVRQSSLSHCLETALTESHYEILLRARPRGEQQLANVRRLLDLAREYDPYQRQGLFRFLRFIEAQEETPTELEPAAVSREAVRLTSIHRSKGLEFPVVVLAGVGGPFNFRDLNEGILLDEHYGLCPKVSPPDSDQSYPGLSYWLARRRQKRELLGEELRLLYVAMTRARDTLILTASSSKKGTGKWPASEAAGLNDQELLSARSYLDWLQLWLPRVTSDQDWSDDREGKSKLLSWTIYDENDPRLASPEESPAETSPAETSPGAAVDEADLAAVGRRLAWQYDSIAATRQRAKTNVTELRRQQGDEEAADAPFVRRSAFTLSPKAKTKLTAAETGVAHHRFLQRISLTETGTSATLKAEAERLGREGWLSENEIAVLDFAALAEFWGTDFGRKILSNPVAVQRELQFTAGLNTADLAVLNLGSADKLPAGEVVVVQGVVDLAVILPEEIWIVDFKTDAVDESELADKVKTYEPQLKLYALALSRIYGRPVTGCALYFLAGKTMVLVEIGQSL